MSLTLNEKTQIVEQYGCNKSDTGSVEVQVALLTTDINKLTSHFQTHVKDLHSRQGLIRKVNLRRKLLEYLKKQDNQRYTKLIASLKIRG
jgi:small subunit ribosomal protein S15